jgi:hypothetical protein
MHIQEGGNSWKEAANTFIEGRSNERKFRVFDKSFCVNG